ncbi:MAG: hypothetical protein Ta2A_12090 [Treponemataceae bacterium]|nr:MAG: hypothetical protein Ta2A_12090 [Treponemataceae bacterium]
MKQIKSEHLMSAFWSGVAYGQLIMEQERMMEEEFDAFQGHLIDKKFCMPSHPAPRRQLRSENGLKRCGKKSVRFLKCMRVSCLKSRKFAKSKIVCLMSEVGGGYDFY